MSVAIKVIGLSLAFGLALAGFSGRVTLRCSASDRADLGDPLHNCYSAEKALLHPRQLLANQDNSLVEFTANVGVGSVLAAPLVGAWIHRNQKAKK